MAVAAVAILLNANTAHETVPANGKMPIDSLRILFVKALEDDDVGKKQKRFEIGEATVR